MTEKLLKWNKIHAFVMIIGVMISIAFDSPFTLSLIALGSFFALGITQNKYINTYANMVTLGRFLLIVLASFLFTKVSVNYILVLLLIAIILDGVDGYLARRYNQASQVGQYFDMEVDAYFVMLMGLYYYQYRDIPEWILIPGLLRYGYSMMMMIIPKEGYIEQKKRYASSIAGVFFFILLAGLLMDNYLYILLLSGSILIAISFGTSIIEYFRFSKKV